MDKEIVKKELVALLDKGREIHNLGETAHSNYYSLEGGAKIQENLNNQTKIMNQAKQDYYFWYYKACRAIRIFASERLAEFERFYTGDTTIKNVADLNAITSGTTHYLQSLNDTRDGEKIDFFDSFQKSFRAQAHILNTVIESFDDPLFNLESNFQYSISKSELDIAKELQKNGHLRAAGAVAGVVIEVHLRTVATNKKIPVPKTSKISIYNEKLKGKAYDATITKQIELCAIIRNKCAHASDNPPTDDEINTIISIAEIIIATVN